LSSNETGTPTITCQNISNIDKAGKCWHVIVGFPVSFEDEGSTNLPSAETLLAQKGDSVD